MLERTETKLAFDFILEVLKQHETELNQSIADLESVTNKVEKWADNLRHAIQELSHESNTKKMKKRQ